jgi:uncharacterized protein (TIRG00374 family)
MTFRGGLCLFIALSVCALIGVFFYTAAPGDVAQIAESLEPHWLFLCLVVLPVADWLIAGLRMYLFSSIVAPSVNYLACVRNCAVGAFMGAATPSQTGGGVAQTYVLVKEGATLGAALGILYLTFLSTLVFYCLAALGLWGLASESLMPSVGTSAPFMLALALFGSLVGLGVAAIAYPAGTRRRLRRLTAWLERRRLPSRITLRIDSVLEECGDTARQLALKHKLRFAAAVCLSIVIFSNKFLAAYFAARGLGLSPPLLDLILIQVLINVLMYFFPTPGASGGAELSAAVLMSSMIPTELLGPFTVLWRSATMYLSVIVGGVILLRYLQRDSRRQAGSSPRAKRGDVVTGPTTVEDSSATAACDNR